MEYDNHKGKLLQEEKRQMWKLIKWVYIVSWVIATGATLIGMLRGKDGTHILFMAMLLFLSLVILFLLFGPQWGPMRLYENGFIPDRVPLKYANKRNDYFVR
ncbi:MAG: hypothetical protein L6265_12645, partial [Thermoplasmatales archaeon]|nr:hypothetical protein [Thermoplasmatales archaeon]